MNLAKTGYRNVERIQRVEDMMKGQDLVNSTKDL
jgi:hypothetical protein